MSFLFFFMEQILELLQLMSSLLNKSITFLKITLKSQDSFLGFITLLFGEVELSSSVLKLSA